MEDIDALLDKAAFSCQSGYHKLEEQGQRILRRARERQAEGIANPSSTDMAELIGGMSPTAIRRYLHFGCECDK